MCLTQTEEVAKLRRVSLQSTLITQNTMHLNPDGELLGVEMLLARSKSNGQESRQRLGAKSLHLVYLKVVFRNTRK